MASLDDGPDRQGPGLLSPVAPGAFATTIARDRAAIRVLFNHGHDPQVGDKPLGPLDRLGEDEEGGYYEVTLLDTAYNRDLRPGLEAGLYGSWFRFQVIRDDRTERPERSSYNPDGLPERTILEAHLHELGPVTWPAYGGATAVVRSLTDWVANWTPARRERALAVLGLSRGG